MSEDKPDPMMEEQAVRDAVTALLVALKVAAGKRGEQLAGLAVLWVTENDESLFDGGLKLIEDPDPDMVLILMNNFLTGVIEGDRASEADFFISAAVN